jgi:hypothetical protein
VPTVPRRPLLAVALTAAVAIVGFPSPSAAAATTLIPTADATVDQAAPSRTYGSSRSLLVDGRHDGDDDYWTYLRFDLGASSAPITKATLRLYVTDSSSDRPTVVRTSGSWTESGITWQNRPAASGTAVRTTDRPREGSWLEYDVRAVLPVSGQVDLVIRPTGGDGVDFSSRTGSRPPQLRIERSSTSPSPSPVPTSTPGATSTPAPTASAAPTPAPTATAAPTSTPAPTASPTAPPSSAGSVVLAAGDVCNPSVEPNAMRTGDVIRSVPGVPVIALGDLQYKDGRLSEFNSCYADTWGSFKSRTKPIPGNHEYQTSGAAGYYDYFGSLAGTRSNGYYSYDIGSSWIGVALNSELSGSAMSTQISWLDGVLKANASKNVVAYMHKPRFSSGEHGNISSVRPLWDVLYANGADLVLAGHDHNYERLAPMRPDGTRDAQGIRSFVVGTGGTTLRSMGSTVNGSEARNDRAWGVLKLTLKSDGYDWQFLPAKGSTYADSGSGAVVDGSR